MKHRIDGENWYPFTDIKNGRYRYYEKKHGKITRKKLDNLVEQGHIRTLELTVKNIMFSYSVYNEYDIIWSLGKGRFKQDHIKLYDGWFK